MDMLRVSCCTYPLRERHYEEAFDVIAAAGFDKIDLLGRMPHFSLDAGELDPEAIKKAADARGLSIANLGTYVGCGLISVSPEEQRRSLEEVKRAIDLANFFGARSIRVFRCPEADDPQYIDAIAEGFKRITDYAAEKGVYMGVENHGGGISGDPDACVELASRVDSPYFGFIYEPFNLVHGGVDYKPAFEVLKDHIVHVHFKDGAEKDGKFETVMLGDGEIDYEWVINRLSSIGYEGTYALEYEIEEVPPEIGLKYWYDTACKIG